MCDARKKKKPEPERTIPELKAEVKELKSQIHDENEALNLPKRVLNGHDEKLDILVELM